MLVDYCFHPLAVLSHGSDFSLAELVNNAVFCLAFLAQQIRKVCHVLFVVLSQELCEALHLSFQYLLVVCCFWDVVEVFLAQEVIEFYGREDE